MLGFLILTSTQILQPLVGTTEAAVAIKPTSTTAARELGAKATTVATHLLTTTAVISTATTVQ